MSRCEAPIKNGDFPSSHVSSTGMFPGWWFQISFYFHPETSARWFQFDEHIFPDGWENTTNQYKVFFPIGSMWVFP